MLIGGASLLTLIIIVMLLSNFFDVPMLRRPSSLISNVMTPVQTFFTGPAGGGGGPCQHEPSDGDSHRP